jgi:predicted SAM-dependent methyltransferase
MKYLEFAAKGKRNANWDGIRDVPMPGCMVYDLTNLPIAGIEDNTYDGIYSEHFIEHLEKDEGTELFHECMRILKPGGVLRTTWPPMEIVEWLQSKKDLSNDEFVKHYYPMYILKHKFAPVGYENHRIQEQVAQGLLYQKGEHKYLWGRSEMIQELEYVGFEHVKEYEYGKSQIAEFNNIDTPNRIRKLHSTVVEARKP